MRNALGFEYLAQRADLHVGRIFSSKRLARQWALRQRNGDWIIYRLWPTGWKQKIDVVGGYFDDWPDDGDLG